LFHRVHLKAHGRLDKPERSCYFPPIEKGFHLDHGAYSVGPYPPALAPLLVALAELNLAGTLAPDWDALPPLAEATAIVLLEPGLALAGVAGAARTTITRTLGDLCTRGLLATIGTGDGERFCLREPEGAHHGQPAVSH